MLECPSSASTAPAPDFMAHTLSIIVPVYNEAGTVAAVVNRLLEIDLPVPREIVVVNDGSTDERTCSLLQTYSRPRTRVVHAERRGLPGARNLGVAHSRGRFLCMLDADDILEHRYLERSLAELQQSPELAFASHWFRAFGEETWEWTPTDCTLATLLRENTVNGAALLRRDVFESLGGFDESFTDGCEDWELWIRATAAGYSERMKTMPRSAPTARAHSAMPSSTECGSRSSSRRSM